jgi:hypothetical protein
MGWRACPRGVAEAMTERLPLPLSLALIVVMCTAFWLILWAVLMEF